MSAYIMNDEDIDAIATTFYDRNHGKGFTGRLYQHRENQICAAAQKDDRQKAIDYIAACLLEINTLSVNNRYSDRTPIRYDYTANSTIAIYDTVELISKIGSWLYQSCEAEFCVNSEVYRTMEDWQAELAIGHILHN